jgi:hypothetical protein
MRQTADISQQIKYAMLMCRKYLFVFSFGLIAFLGLYNVVNYGLASLSFYSVQNTISAWQENSTLQNETSYNKAKDAVASARGRHTAHPLYTDLSGQIYEWAAIGGYHDQSVALEVSKRFYLKAVKMRPTWPVTYASLAMNKWRSNEFDAELKEYIELANKYGPKKAEVNILIVELGLALYRSNHPFYEELRPFLKQRISQGLRNSQSQTRILSAIEHYDLKRTSCRWMRELDPYVYKNKLQCDNS